MNYMHLKRRLLPIGISLLLLTGCGTSVGSTYSNNPDEAAAKAQEEVNVLNQISTFDEANDSNISLNTSNYSVTKKYIQEQIAEADAVIASESEANSQYYGYKTAEKDGLMQWNVLVHIDPKEYRDFLNVLKETEHTQLMAFSSTDQDIDSTSSNQEAEIKTLEAEQKRLLEILNKAETVDEMLQVESRVTEVETLLNQSKAESSESDTDENYASVFISLNEVSFLQDSDSSYSSRILLALTAGGQRFLERLETILFLAVLYLPELLIAVLILAVFLRILLRRRKQSEETLDALLRELTDRPNSKNES